MCKEETVVLAFCNLTSLQLFPGSFPTKAKVGLPTSDFGSRNSEVGSPSSAFTFLLLPFHIYMNFNIWVKMISMKSWLLTNLDWGLEEYCNLQHPLAMLHFPHQHQDSWVTQILNMFPTLETHLQHHLPSQQDRKTSWLFFRKGNHRYLHHLQEVRHLK